LAEELNTGLLEKNPDVAGAPRIAAFSETGYPGLKNVSKQILEESDKVWRMPQRIKTVDEMSKDATVSAALQFYTVYLAEASYKIVPPAGATPKQKEEKKFIETVFNDMDESFFSTFVAILSYLRYGFSVFELQAKRRLPGKSAHKDGLIGLKGLKPRSQSTISGWVFSEDGRELLAVEQSTANMQYGSRYSSLAKNGAEIVLPVEKLAIFTSMPINNNPEGVSILRGAYNAWRYKRSIEDAEITGAARDLSGLFLMKMPAGYLDPNADAGKKAAAEDFKKVARNVSLGEQAALIIPSDRNAESKEDMFTAELLSSSGAKAFDTSEIISRWDSRILLSLFADILQVGSNGTGSQSMIEGKTELVEIGLQYRLKEIESVFNKTIIPWIYAQNQWDASECVQLKFDKISKPSQDSIGKLVQRVVSVSAIEKDRAFMNYVREAGFGLQGYPEDEPVHEELLGESSSRSGDGMEVGVTGEGTAKKPGGGDKSSANTENAE